MNDIFDLTKFEKLTKNTLETNLKSYSKLAYRLNKHLSIVDNSLIQPKESLKRGYGLL